MKKLLLLLVGISLLLPACNQDDYEYSYAQPVNLNDGIAIGNIDDTDINVSLINKAVEKVHAGKFNEIHSFLIYKDNKLILEEYFPGYKYQWDGPKYHGEFVDWNPEMRHNIMSCTKSFTSACINIAIREGFIENVNQSIFDYLPAHQRYKTDNREYITIEHLLTMTSGLAWNEWNAPHGTNANDIDRLYFDCSEDPVACVLERPLVSIPGESFTYNGGGIIVLGEILRYASGMNIEEFADKYLFDILGIENTYWWKFPDGTYENAGSLEMTPRSMLKLGILYINNGVWHDKQIIDPEWVHKSSVIYNNNRDIKVPIEDSGINGYGYTWWISDFEVSGKNIHMYRANGWGGQVIMVIPDLDMVVVLTSGNWAGKSKLFKLMKKYVLPAVVQ